MNYFPFFSLLMFEKALHENDGVVVHPITRYKKRNNKNSKLYTYV